MSILVLVLAAGLVMAMANIRSLEQESERLKQQLKDKR